MIYGVLSEFEDVGRLFAKTQFQLQFVGFDGIAAYQNTVRFTIFARVATATSCCCMVAAEVRRPGFHLPVQELLTWRSTAAPAFERPHSMVALSSKWGPPAASDLRASAGIGSQRLLPGVQLTTQTSVAGSDVIQAIHVRTLQHRLSGCTESSLRVQRP